MNDGKQGERLARNLFASWGYGVEDVSANPEYYYKGDILLTSPTTGAKRIVEVKWDGCIATTGNLFLEIWSRNSRKQNCNGWWKWCGADYLAYGDARKQVFYLFDMAQLKERVAQLQLRTKRCGQDSEGLILPLAQVEDLILNKGGK